ncbi:FAD-binding domain-containing protein [Thozetella sp. PMI_491]|nr:FAD-binding domain-containing protein [Thozetella sp. PMI_491]
MSLLAWLLAIPVTGVLSTSSVADNVAICCNSLSQQFPGQVVYANGSEYNVWNHRWADTAELAPSCIFRPLSAADVSFAVKAFGTGAGKSTDFCPFSIKSGGHTPWAGANDVDAGVALDLSNMNSSVLSADRSYISIGGGAIWHDAYTRSNGTGVAYPGGRCPGTGVGGVTLGGGYSWFTGEVGFVADSILNYEVVLASGQIVNANSTSNHDLFRALKGGNNNFGVVTRFDLQVFEHDQMVYGGLIILPASSSDEVLEAFQNFTDDSTGVSPSAGLTIEFFLDSPEGDGQILLWLIDTDAEGDHAGLQPFLDMEPKLVDRVQTSTIADYTSNIPAVTRVLMADATFVNDLETLKGVNNITLEIFQKYSYIPNLTWDYQLEPLSRHIIQASNAKGGNVMGLEEIEDQLIIFIMPLWVDSAYDADVYEAAETWYNAVKGYTASVGKDVSFEFANYAAPFQNIMASYGPVNLQFLKDTSRKYDPSQLFQKAVKGGYKLH